MALTGLDLTKIDFPSDNLTFKTMRQRHPEQVDINFDCMNAFNNVTLGSIGGFVTDLLYAERMVAEGAFFFEAGLPDHSMSPEDLKTYKEDLQSYKEELIETYQELGFASGSHSATQLLQGIESQAKAQARQHTGKLPMIPPRGAR